MYKYSTHQAATFVTIWLAEVNFPLQIFSMQIFSMILVDWHLPAATNCLTRSIKVSKDAREYQSLS